MKTIDADYQMRLNRDTTTLALGILIEPRDNGTPVAYTDHDKPLVYGGHTYESTNSLIPKQIEEVSDLSVGNSSIMGIIDGEIITRDDLLAHYYDNAAVTITMLDWARLDITAPVLRRGWLGEIQVNDNTFVAELRGLKQALQQQIGRTISPDCDANLGDSKCKVDLTAFTQTIVVTAVIDNGNFEGTIASGGPGVSYWYNYGPLEWTSGNNNGVVRNIREQTYSDPTYTIGLIYPMEKSIEIGDTASIVAGCNKGRCDCSNKFHNWLNFRGFPFVPGPGLLRQVVGR